MRTHHLASFCRSLVRATLASAVALALFLPTEAGAVPRVATAKSDCGSGYFCVWSSTNYSGSIQRFSSTNSYRAITLSSTRSYYNNRSYRTWLHAEPNGGGSTVCINPGGSVAVTSGWQTLAEAVYLATITSC